MSAKSLILALSLIPGIVLAGQVTDRNGRVWDIPKAASFDGRVLRISRDVPSTALAVAPVDLTPFADAEVRLSLRVSGLAVSNPSQRWKGVKVMLRYCDKERGKTVYPQAVVPRGDFTGVFELVWPLYGAQTADAVLCLGLEGASGTVEFDLDSLVMERCVGRRLKHADDKVSYPDDVRNRRQLRGCMVSPNVSEKDLNDLAGWGAKLIRYQLLPTGSFLLQGTDEAQKTNHFWKSLAVRMDHAVTNVFPCARRLGLKVVVDMHMYPEELIYTSHVSRATLVSGWKSVAKRLKGFGDAVYGYDLMNEPPHCDPDVLWTFWDVQNECAKEIRAIDPDVTLIVACGDGDSPSGFETMDALGLDNVIYTVHVYNPLEYTHQFVTPKLRPERAKKTAIPENIEDYLRHALYPVRRFQRRHGCKILVGEFSVAAWAERGDEYLDACIRIFNDYGWDWTYHAFREATVWSVEHESDGPFGIRRPSVDNPRKRVLLKGLSD